jgi:hypothetical protein
MASFFLFLFRLEKAYFKIYRFVITAARDLVTSGAI